MSRFYLFTKRLRGWARGVTAPAGTSASLQVVSENNLNWKFLKSGAGAQPPALVALTASPAVATVGAPYVGTVTGRKVGSTAVLTGAGSAGLKINGRNISGTPTVEGPVNIVETLAGAAGSPRTSAAVVTVSE